MYGPQREGVMREGLGKLRLKSRRGCFYAGPFIAEEHFNLSESESEVAQSCPTLCDLVDCSPSSSSVHGISRQKCCGPFLLRGIFLTQGSNLSLLCLLHWQVDSLPLSHCINTLFVKPDCVEGRAGEGTALGLSVVSYRKDTQKMINGKAAVTNWKKNG